MKITKEQLEKIILEAIEEADLTQTRVPTPAGQKGVSSGPTRMGDWGGKADKTRWGPDGPSRTHPGEGPDNKKLAAVAKELQILLNKIKEAL